MIERPPSTGRYPTRRRGLFPDDPIRLTDPRAVEPNANEALGTTGPNVAAGFGDTHVMYPAAYPPAQAEAWAGWPNGWGTPLLEQNPMYSTFFGYGRTDPDGYLRRVSTVGICVDKQSRQLASFPAYGFRGDRPVALPDWYQTSPEPLLYADWCEFMKAAVNSYLLRGEAILWATSTFADGFPARFIALNPDTVDVDDDGTYWIGARDTGTELARREVCHIKYQRDAGVDRRGIGPLEWAARNLVSVDVLDRYALSVAMHGLPGILTAPGELSDKQSADARSQWSANRQANPGLPAILSGGLTYQPVQLSPRDMAMLDLKVFDLQMIAVALGVQPGLAGLPQSGGGLEYSSVDMLADHHWRDGLRPLAQAFAGALSNWLLPRGTRLEFNPDRYVQPGLGERAQAWATLHGIVEDRGARATTVDEIRRFERWSPWAAVGDTVAAVGDTGALDPFPTG